MQSNSTVFWDDFSSHGDKIALVSGDQFLSYNDLDKKIKSFNQQIGQEKSLLLLGVDNSIESVIALYGALHGGHTVMLCDNENLSLRKNLSQDFSPNYEYFSIDGKFELSPHNNSVKPQELHPDLTLMVSTSGSTGSSKCVRLSSKNILSNTQSICDYLSINSQDTAALVLPFHYCYGLSVLNSHLSVGATVHIGDLSIASPDFFDYLRTHKITSFAGVPYSFEILERASFREQHLPDLRYVTQAGGRLSPEIVKKYSQWSEDYNSQFYVMYGQTEATSRISYLPPEKLSRFPESIGIPIPGGELSLQDDTGNKIVKPNHEGELIYRGNNVMMGYAESTKDLKRSYEHEYLETGDLAYQNEEGLFCIVGRLKRFSKIYGKRVNLDEVERLLASNNYQTVCVSDDKTLFVCSENSTPLATKELINNSFDIAEQNIELIHLSKLPLLSSGKTDYQKILRTAIETQSLTENNNTNSISSSSDIKESILTTYKKYLKLETITEEDSFSDLGGNSVTYVAVSIELEKTLGELPNTWPKIPIRNLAELNKPTKASFLSLESSIVLRFYAILAVVSNHAGLDFLRGGAALLLLISGYNYARFQFGQQLLGQPHKIFNSIFLNILLPYWGVLIGYCTLTGKHLDIYDLLLIGNNIVGESSQVFGIWFIEALIQSIVIFTIPLFFKPIRTWVAQHSFYYIISLFIIACLARVGDELSGWGSSNSFGGEQISWVFWLFSLGVLIHFSEKNLRITLSVATIILAFWFYNEDTPRSLTIAVGALIILWIDKIHLPKFIIPFVSIISTSSLFIYLLHPRAPIDSFTSQWSIDFLRIFIGVCLGIIAYYSYTYLLSKFQAISKRIFGLINKS